MKVDGTDAAIRVLASNPVEMPVRAVKPESRPVAKESDELGQEYRISDSFIKTAIEKANRAMVIYNRSLEFRVHEKTKEIMVRVINNDTKEVIREIPPEKILDMFASMLERAGLLVDERR
jgi:flagellar protein FlaG